MCKVYTGYRGTSKIDHGLCACTVDNPLAKAWGLSLLTGAQTMHYLSHVLRRLEFAFLALILFFHLQFTGFHNNITCNQKIDRLNV